jgi:FKBP-type peptidyl-prolyl cis-trans isomerase
MPFEKTDLTPGTGAEIKSGQNALVHYTGWLYEAAAPENKGKQFDSSVGGEPFEFAVGAGHVIAGWDQGVAGMKVGGKRRLVIPPDMGYGARGAGGGLIPPNATLLFDVELVEIR